MKLIGQTSIHPLFFYTGKVSGYAVWVIFLFSFFHFTKFVQPNDLLKILSLILAMIALIIFIISIINLGRSTRLGLPKEGTELVIKGLYQYSRNPMYLAFDLFTVSAIIFTWHWLIALLGLYSIIIYHFIILAEEKFLEKRFDEKYLDYKTKVRRYI